MAAKTHPSRRGDTPNKAAPRETAPAAPDESAAAALRVIDETAAAPALSPEEAAALAERLERAVEREISAIEQAQAAGAAADDPGAAERTARTLSTLARTLKDAQSLREAAARAILQAEDDDLPTDIDARRRELARRIHAFVESRTGGALYGASKSGRGEEPSV